MIHIHNLFTNPLANPSLFESLYYIKQAVKERKLSNIDISDDTIDETNRNKYFQYFLQESEIFFENSSKKTFNPPHHLRLISNQK